jgi:hypothetical protein
MMGEYEQIIRERLQIGEEYIKENVIQKETIDPILLTTLYAKIYRNCLITLGKLFDRTYNILKKDEIIKEMFNEENPTE